METASQVTKYAWDDMPKEQLSDQLSRRLITGDKMMLAHVYLKKGCVVPLHHHINEQITYILEGALRFHIGAEDGEEIIVRAGEVLHIPSNVPHTAEAFHLHRSPIEVLLHAGCPGNARHGVLSNAF